MRRVLSLLLAAAFVLTAGCLDADDGTNQTDTGDEAPDPGNKTLEPITTSTSGTIQSGVGTPVVSSQQGGGSHLFQVTGNATSILVEVTWDSDDFDLDLALKEPGTTDDFEWQHWRQGGMPGSPDNPHSIQIDDPAKGGWEATVFPNGAAADTTFTIYSTVFYGPIPDGYTAIASSSTE